MAQQQTKQHQQNPQQHGEHKQGEHKQQEQKKEKRANFLVYNGRIALRFYSRLVQEAILALMLIAPLWAYFRLKGIESITIPTDLPTLMVIAFVAFMLQSFMFNKA